MTRPWFATLVAVPLVALSAAASAKEVATLHDAVFGDSACYLTLTDAAGAIVEATATFEVCEAALDHIGRRVSLGYGTGSILAPSCEGDPACQDTVQVDLVTGIAPAP